MIEALVIKGDYDRELEVEPSTVDIRITVARDEGHDYNYENIDLTYEQAREVVEYLHPILYGDSDD